jgi:hypothetical protein
MPIENESFNRTCRQNPGVVVQEMTQRLDRVHPSLGSTQSMTGPG